MSDKGSGTVVKNSLEIVTEQVHLEGGYKRGGRIRVAKCMRQNVPDRGSTLISNSAQTRQSTLTSHLFKVLQSTTNNCNYNCTHQKTGIKTHTKTHTLHTATEKYPTISFDTCNTFKTKNNRKYKIWGWSITNTDSLPLVNIRSGLAQSAERWTKEPGTILTQVQFPRAARDCSPRANLLYRLSYSVCTAPRVQMHGHW